MKKITELSDQLTNITTENKYLNDENTKFRSCLEKCMKNFSCFMNELRRTNEVEAENLALKEKLEALNNVHSNSG